ncbi:MAG: thioredoxin family protein, partial [Planctomycetaceae bacterium]|nr:thioredoxin family protein [Planctomycetaceae bacterium]
MAAITGQPRGEVLDFSATWCGPCQQMAPIVSKLERQGYPIRKVDVDTNRALAQKYGISSIPAFVLVVDGKEVTRIVGAVSEQQLVGMLSQIPSDPPVMTAQSETSGPSRSRPSETPRRSREETSTQPVMALAEDEPRSTTSEDNERPSARGLIGKLFN